MHNIFEAGSVFIFMQRSAKPGGPLSSGYSQSLGTTETVTCYNMYLRSDLV